MRARTGGKVISPMQFIRRTAAQKGAAHEVSFAIYGDPNHILVGWLMGKASLPFGGNINMPDVANEVYQTLCETRGIDPHVIWSDA